VKLEVLTVVSNDHILLGCDATYFGAEVPAFRSTGNEL
jgi:hypothetical protein